MRGESPPEPIAQRIAAHLAHYLGPNNARVAVRTFSERCLGRPAETLTPADVPALAHALRPMLCTLLGNARGEKILERITEDLAP